MKTYRPQCAFMAARSEFSRKSIMHEDFVVKTRDNFFVAFLEEMLLGTSFLL